MTAYDYIPCQYHSSSLAEKVWKDGKDFAKGSFKFESLQSLIWGSFKEQQPPPKSAAKSDSRIFHQPTGSSLAFSSTGCPINFVPF